MNARGILWCLAAVWSVLGLGGCNYVPTHEDAKAVCIARTDAFFSARQAFAVARRVRADPSFDQTIYGGLIGQVKSAYDELGSGLRDDVGKVAAALRNNEVTDVSPPWDEMRRNLKTRAKDLEAAITALNEQVKEDERKGKSVVALVPLILGAVEAIEALAGKIKEADWELRKGERLQKAEWLEDQLILPAFDRLYPPAGTSLQQEKKRAVDDAMASWPRP